jgi:hypothetical protein
MEYYLYILGAVMVLDMYIRLATADAKLDYLRDKILQLQAAQRSTTPDNEAQSDPALVAIWQEKIRDLPIDSPKWKAYKKALDRAGVAIGD